MTEKILPCPNTSALDGTAEAAAQCTLNTLIQNWEPALADGADIRDLLVDIDNVVAYLRNYAHDAFRAARKYTVQVSVYQGDQLQYDATVMKRFATYIAATDYVTRMINKIKKDDS